jgi:adenylate kinase
MIRSPVQVILLGPPGAGKGTQAIRLTQRLGLVHINPGQILREEADRDTPVGRRIRMAMAAGDLVPDELVDRLVADRLAALTPGQGFVLDGYPRTAGEARSLRRTLRDLHRLRQPPLVVWLEAPREELIRRLRARGEEQRRADDSDEAIARRLAVDAEQAGALRAALAGWTDLVVIDATRPPDELTEEILRALRDQAAARRPDPAKSVFRSPRS